MESKPDDALSFAQLGLHPSVLQAVTGLGYETPTPVQARCIPHLLEGRDLLGQAQTGTGKTAAFALPLLSRLDLERNEPQVLVLAPTRELALQVAEAFQSYAHHLEGFHVLPVYGGQSMSLQLRQLKRGPHVIVGTPGRVMDHLRRGTLGLDAISTLVLDEADEMLKMGFAEDIEWIFQQAPEGRQVALFSATMPKAIRRVAQQHLNDAVEIKVEAKTETVSTIEQLHCVVTRYRKLDTLTRMLEVEEFDAMIVFVRTKTATEELAEKLNAHGFSAEALNGDMNQAQRERTIGRLKDGRTDIVVATDVAARGLDVERISHVVNYDIPMDPESYVHRIGRTGRAGRKGRALLLVQPRERYLLKAIEKATRQRIGYWEPPSAEELTEHRIDRFKQRLRKTLDSEDLDFCYRVVSRIEQEEEMSPLDIAAALTFLTQGERPLEVREERARRRERPARDHEERHRGDDRGERPPRRVRERRDDDIPRDTYRIEVGRNDHVTPREIVGAIANEAGLDGRLIGRIEIYDDYSTVDLPEGMPKDIFRHLRGVYVARKQLRISRLDGTGDGRPRKFEPGGRPVRKAVKKTARKKGRLSLKKSY
jgi:ATP-dependent RNA helicase DeaD